MGFGSNIEALKAQRALSQSSAGLSKTFERLASGQRINRAGDDAAGLAIADGLRNKARLYSQSIRNVSDGISALNIVDGALGEQGGILTRLKELAEQSANGTYSDQQRSALNLEYLALVEEFGRIGDSTSFNERALLLSGRGSNPSTLTLQAGVDGGTGSQITSTLLDTGSLSGTIQISGDIVAQGGGGSPDGLTTIEDMLDFFNFVSATGLTRSAIDAKANSQVIQRTITLANGTQREMLFTFNDGYTNNEAAVVAFAKNASGTYDSLGATYFNFNTTTGKMTGSGILDLSSVLGVAYSLDLRGLSIFNSNPWGAGVAQIATTTAMDTTNVKSVTAALRSLTVVQARMDELNNFRGTLGASLSRLESALSAASVARETNQGAEAQIRDADVAQESAALTRFQILQQVSANVLGLANQQPRLLLDLLRS